MKNMIRLEELAMLLLALFTLGEYDSPWWCYLLLVIGPDVSMVGYLAGNKMGAWVYNFFHHKGVAVLTFLPGLIFSVGWIAITGVILFGHSSMDRFFGYGLKTEQGFKHTHLGIIGKRA